MGIRDPRARYLEEIARQMADTLMNTPGVVEIREEMDSATGDIVMRASCVVEDLGRQRERSRGEIPEKPITATQIRREKMEVDRVREMIERNSMLTSMRLDAMRYAPQQIYFSEKMDPANFGSAGVNQPSTISLDTLEKLKKAFNEEAFDPAAFLQKRIGLKKTKDETRAQFNERQKVEAAMKKNTKKPGETPIRVEIGVRKIQMPGGE